MAAFLIVGITAIIYRPAISLVFYVARWTSRRKLAISLRRDLTDQCKALGGLIGDSSNSYPRFFTNVATWQEFSPRFQYDSEHLETIKAWQMSISEQLSSLPISRFFEASASLCQVARQYNRFCEQTHKKLEIATSQVDLPDNRRRNLLQEGTLCRERHNNFMREVSVFAKQVNSTFSHAPCNEHFQELPPLTIVYSSEKIAS